MNSTGLIKISEATKYDSNPFVDENLVSVKKATKNSYLSSKHSIVNEKTGELTPVNVIQKVQEVDSESFVKLYTGAVQSMFDLTKTGLKVFGYIVSILKPNSDRIYININKLKLYTEYNSTAPVYKGLSELLSCNIIAMSDDPNMWFINPAVVFNGDRIALVSIYQRIHKKDEENKRLYYSMKPNVDMPMLGGYDSEKI